MICLGCIAAGEVVHAIGRVHAPPMPKTVFTPYSVTNGDAEITERP